MKADKAAPVTAVATSYCRACNALVQVTLQLPPGTTSEQVNADLASVSFEAVVLHEIAEHIDGLGAA